MAFCKNCGTELYEGQKFCGNCGTPTDEKYEKRENNASSEQGTYYDEAPKTEPINDEVFDAPVQTGKLSTGQLVFSIINIVFCIKTLGIIALVMTLISAEISDRIRAAKYLKIAKILNIISVCAGAFAIVAVVAYVIFAFFISSVLGVRLMSFM